MPIAKNVRYGVIYFDGQFNDSMMVRDIILTTTFRSIFNIHTKIPIS